MKRTSDCFDDPECFTEILMSIMPFLVWSADDGYVCGGRDATDVLESFRILLGYDSEKFELLCNIFRNAQ